VPDYDGPAFLGLPEDFRDKAEPDIVVSSRFFLLIDPLVQGLGLSEICPRFRPLLP
jgi:hypothetical protein